MKYKHSSNLDLTLQLKIYNLLIKYTQTIMKNNKSFLKNYEH